jgi:hypothetical protein
MTIQWRPIKLSADDEAAFMIDVINKEIDRRSPEDESTCLFHYTRDEIPVMIIMWRPDKGGWVQEYGINAYTSGVYTLHWDMVAITVPGFNIISPTILALLNPLTVMPEPDKEDFDARAVRPAILPANLRRALVELAAHEGALEWGGGIDYEIVLGEATVERVVTFLGQEGAVDGGLFAKWGTDLEVLFHTHPNVNDIAELTVEVHGGWATPSEDDIAVFLQWDQQISIIIAEHEILVMIKGPRTKGLTQRLSSLAVINDMTATDPDLLSVGGMRVLPIMSYHIEDVQKQHDAEDAWLRRVFGFEVFRIPTDFPDDIELDIGVVEEQTRPDSPIMRRFERGHKSKSDEWLKRRRLRQIAYNSPDLEYIRRKTLRELGDEDA